MSISKADRHGFTGAPAVLDTLSWSMHTARTAWLSDCQLRLSNCPLRPLHPPGPPPALSFTPSMATTCRRRSHDQQSSERHLECCEHLGVVPCPHTAQCTHITMPHHALSTLLMTGADCAACSGSTELGRRDRKWRPHSGLGVRPGDTVPFRPHLPGRAASWEGAAAGGQQNGAEAPPPGRGSRPKWLAASSLGQAPSCRWDS